MLTLWTVPQDMLGTDWIPFAAVWQCLPARLVPNISCAYSEHRPANSILELCQNASLRSQQLRSSYTSGHASRSFKSIQTSVSPGVPLPRHAFARASFAMCSMEQDTNMTFPVPPEEHMALLAKLWEDGSDHDNQHSLHCAPTLGLQHSGARCCRKPLLDACVFRPSFPDHSCICQRMH